MTLGAARRTINYLLNTGAAYSSLNSFSGTLFLKSYQVGEVEGQPTTQRFTPPLLSSCGKIIFSLLPSYITMPQLSSRE